MMTWRFWLAAAFLAAFAVSGDAERSRSETMVCRPTACPSASR
jgi:hypothetical protein